jgi:hypothetical protein
MHRSSQENNKNDSTPSCKRIELLFSNFAEQFGGIYRVEAGMDKRDIAGVESVFSNWLLHKVVIPWWRLLGKSADLSKSDDQRLINDHYETVYVQCQYETWNIEFRASLAKTQTNNRARVFVTCPILLKSKFNIVVGKQHKLSGLPSTNKAWNIPKWLSVFLPNRFIKTCGTSFATSYKFQFRDEANQNAFLASFNDPAIGEKFVQDPRIQKCLSSFPAFEYLTVGYKDGLTNDRQDFLELWECIDGQNSQPLENALQLTKTSLALMKDFDLIISAI